MPCLYGDSQSAKKLRTDHSRLNARVGRTRVQTRIQQFILRRSFKNRVEVRIEYSVVDKNPRGSAISRNDDPFRVRAGQRCMQHAVRNFKTSDHTSDSYSQNRHQVQEVPGKTPDPLNGTKRFLD